MKTLSKTIADMNIEELQQSANASFEEAATLPPGPQKQNIILLAHMIRVLAELKKVVIISESECRSHRVRATNAGSALHGTFGIDLPESAKRASEMHGVQRYLPFSHRRQSLVAARSYQRPTPRIGSIDDPSASS